MAENVATDGYTGVFTGVPPFFVSLGGRTRWDDPVSDTVTLTLPRDAQPGTYVAAIKARRNFGGEALNRAATTTVQVGTVTPTTFTPATGKCENCHQGPSGFDRILRRVKGESALSQPMIRSWIWARRLPSTCATSRKKALITASPRPGFRMICADFLKAEIRAWRWRETRSSTSRNSALEPKGRRAKLSCGREVQSNFGLRSYPKSFFILRATSASIMSKPSGPAFL